MTTTEIYALANETTEKQFENLFNTFNSEELIEFNSLVRLGDKKELALWTVISNRYNETDKEFYKNAYES